MPRRSGRSLTAHLTRVGAIEPARSADLAAHLIARGVLPTTEATESEAAEVAGHAVLAGGAEPERGATGRGNTEPGAAEAPWLAGLARCADPDAALIALARLCDAIDGAAPGSPDTTGTPPGAPPTLADLAALLADDAGARRLLAVLGGSSALADLLVRHPALLAELEPAAPGITLPAEEVRSLLANASANAPDPTGALRLAYRRRLLQIATEDLASDEPERLMPEVSRALSDLAGAALDAALSIARRLAPDDAAAVRLAVIGMGKCGGRELNYVSDVDVIYVAEPIGETSEADAMAAAARLATCLAQVCSSPAPPTATHVSPGPVGRPAGTLRGVAVGTEPPLWPVDAALRPEGKSGPLVRTLASHRDYLDRWAQTWEFQALLKARPVAGDLELGQRYVELVAPYVWRASERDRFVADAQAMRQRVIAHLPADQADRELKLGRGGLRDVEFTVQLLQLVHGRSDHSLRDGATLPALAALSAGGYVSRADAEALDACYRQLRVWEHRLQLAQLRRTHLLPTSEAELRRLARASCTVPARADDVEKAWRATRRRVRDLHEELFYRPLLPETAKLSADEAVLAPGPARDRLAALGYRDPEGALRHIAALTQGVSRRAAIQRQLLPVMLGWFAEGADPDAALLAFRDLSDKLGSTPWYLRMLRDSGTAAPRLAHVLSASRFIAAALGHFPEAVAWLGADEELTPPGPQRVTTEASAIAGRSTTDEAAVGSLRAMRHREMARIGMALVLGMIDFPQARRAVTEVTDAVVTAALDAILSAPQATDGTDAAAPACELAVIGFGSYGAREMGFGSDADVIFVHRPLDVGPDAERAAQDQATQWAGRLVSLLGKVGPHPPVVLDADLRPEGRNGPLSRSLHSVAEYYERWAQLWERQALLRARVVTVAGLRAMRLEPDGETRAAATDRADAAAESGAAPGLGSPGAVSDLASRYVALIDPLRYRPTGLADPEVREVRRMKARVESERLPRGAEPTRHVKLGPGGMSDVEWLCQLQQLRHAGVIPQLRVLGTCEALAALADAGLLPRADARALREAWLSAAAIRDANVLWRGRADAKTNEVPHDRLELAGIAGLLGASPSDVEQDYLRHARLARAVFDRDFYE